MQVDQTFFDKVQTHIDASKRFNLGWNYGDVKRHALDVGAADDDFIANPLQCWIAAQALASSSRIQMHLAAPGEGKTFAFLLLADMILSKDTTGTVKVIIYAAEPVIAHQIK